MLFERCLLTLIEGLTWKGGAKMDELVGLGEPH